MKTFKDLKFETHFNHMGSPFGDFGEQAKLEFPNGYGVSVITGGSGVYGDTEHPYELAVLQEGNLTYDTPVTDDVLGYLTVRGVTTAMKKVQAL